MTGKREKQEEKKKRRYGFDAARKRPGGDLGAIRRTHEKWDQSNRLNLLMKLRSRKLAEEE